MKREIQSKLLLCLYVRPYNQGFTFIELLVVIIILSILATLALPSFMSCGSKAKNSEAKQNVGIVIRSQIAYYDENKSFANAFNKLQLGVLNSNTSKAETIKFQYLIQNTKTSTFIYAIPQKDAYKKAFFGIFTWNQNINIELKGYVGAVFLDTKNQKNTKLNFKIVVCEANNFGTSLMKTPTLKNNVPACDSNTRKLT